MAKGMTIRHAPKFGTSGPNKATHGLSVDGERSSPRRRLRIALTRAVLPLILAAACATPVFAQSKKDPPKIEGRLIVDDGAGLFTTDGMKKAKAMFLDIKDRYSREMLIVTYKELTAAQKKDFEKLEKPEAKQQFWSEWGKTEMAALKPHGVAVLICRSPGHIQVYADNSIRTQGFTVHDEQLVMKGLLETMKEAKDKPEAEQAAIRDKGLLNAAEFVRDAYKKMVR